MKIRNIVGQFDAGGLELAVVVAEFNRAVCDGLLEGALTKFREAGADDVTVIRVPGAFELPLAVRRTTAMGFDGVLTLGALIKGETDHYEYIAEATTSGLMQVMLETDTPVAFGVLTTRHPDHALARSQPGPHNKGAEAAVALLKSIRALRALRDVQQSIDAEHRQRQRERGAAN